MSPHPGPPRRVKFVVSVVLLVSLVTLAAIGLQQRSTGASVATSASVATGPCAAGQAVPAIAATPPGIENDDDKLAAVARIVPGFSGMFFELGLTDRLIVTVADPSEPAAIRAAIVAVYGPDRIPSGGIEVRAAQYRFTQLKAWYDCMRNHIWQVQGLSGTDLNEGTNRIELHVTSEESVAPVWAKIRQLGIPAQAVTVKVTGPMLTEPAPAILQ